MGLRKSIFNFLFFSFILFGAQLCGNAQTSSVYAIDSIADIEKKAFLSQYAANQRGNGQPGLTRVASSNDFDVNYYRCEWTIDPAVRFISGKVTSYFTITSLTNSIIFDLSDTLNVDSITYHGNQVSYQRAGNDALKIIFPSNLNIARKDSISIFYNGVPRNRSSYQAFTQAIHNGTPIIWTLSEPYGAKEWWPCKNGLDDKADSIDVIITSPSAYNATSNGLQKDVSVSGANRTVHFSHRYPIASYLVAVAVTNYVTTKDSAIIGTKTVPLIANAFPENVNDFAPVIFNAKRCIVKFSELFGEYPFSKEQYSQTQCMFGGGMEHQTNTFTGSTWSQLIAHELGHHWFGDHITCGSWQHIWLNEGFANYIQFIYVENFDTTLIVAHLNYYLNLITSIPDGSVFVSDTSSPARIFDSRLTYAKGGYVVHMLRGILGDSLFFKGLRQYLNDPAISGGFAKTNDLMRNLEQISGKNLHTFFQKWIYGEGYPMYSSSWMQNKNNWSRVQINQTTSHASVPFYEMPIQLEFKNSVRDTIITVNNQQNGEAFWVNVGFAADTMLLDPKLWILTNTRTVKKIAATSTSENDISIFPNPATDHLTIKLLNPTLPQLNIQLYDIAGKLLYKYQKNISGSDETITLPFFAYPKGVYILKVDGINFQKIKKVIRK